MSIRNKGLVAALEALDADSSTNGDESALLESSSAVNETAEEVEDTSDDISEEVTAIEEASEDLETLGDIRDTMEESVETGEGMDETAAEIAEVAVEAICAKLGFKPSYKPMPATEDYRKQNTRVVHTKVAIEGISETMGKIWSGISAAVDRTSNTLSLFLSGLTKNTKVVSEHLQNLKAKVAELDKSNTKASEELSSKAIAVAFSDNKVADFKTAMGIVTRTVSLVNAGRSLTKELVSLTDQVQKAASSLETGEKTIGEVNTKLTSLINEKVGKLGKLPLNLVSSLNRDDVVDGGVTEIQYIFGPFVNTQVLEVYQLKAPNNYPVSVLGLLSIKNLRAESANALVPGEMSKLLDNALGMIKVTEEFAQSQGDVKTIATNLKKAIDATAKSVAKTDTPEVKSASKSVRSAIKNYVAMTTSLANSFPGIAITTGKAVGDYVAASIANWEPKSSAAPTTETE